MNGRLSTVFSACLAACGLVIAGCGRSSPSSAHAFPASPSAQSAAGSPVQTAIAWFDAINDKNVSQVNSFFAPGVYVQLGWNEWKPSTWSTFSAVRCRKSTASVFNATVFCSFNETQSPSEGNPDAWWTVSMQRRPQQRWLITSYGQG
jgi:hypothetical protein